MKFYKHWLGDYARDTGHLSLLEHGAYRVMLDAYYSNDKPLPAEKAALYRICKAFTGTERKAVERVADEFFPVNGDGSRHNRRADEEIAGANAFAEAQAKRAHMRWHSVGNPSHSHSQEPEEAKSKTERLSRAAPDPAKQDAKRERRKIAIQALEFLNEKTGRSYEPVPANVDRIAVIVEQGSTLEDLRAVIAKKCREWGGDEKMSQYLRPKTLFNATNFANYKGELGAPEPAIGRRPSIKCSECGERAFTWTGDRCDPCWRKSQGLASHA